MVVGKVTEKSYLQTILEGGDEIEFSGIPNGTYKVVVYSIKPGAVNVNQDNDFALTGDEDEDLPVTTLVNVFGTTNFSQFTVPSINAASAVVTVVLSASL
jgi:hypothetical protein